MVTAGNQTAQLVNPGQRRIVIRASFAVAAVCLLLIVVAFLFFAYVFLVFAGPPATITDAVFALLWFGWPVALTGLIAWLIGLCVRAGAQREAGSPSTTGGTPPMSV